MATIEELLEENLKLKQENVRLKNILKEHHISYEQKEEHVIMNLKEKIAVYTSYFRGRNDVFTERYMRNGKKGYSFVCVNKGVASCIIKSGVKNPCGHCEKRQYMPFTDAMLLEHMKGSRAFGIYPIVDNDKCYFLSIDFDDLEFRSAAIAYKQECEKLGIDSVIELSQSGKGAHVWIFFEKEEPVKVARTLGDYILSNAMYANKDISFKSYDRFFPAQDNVDASGLGNCIALPLQGNCVRGGTSVFVDADFHMIPHPIEYLSGIRKISSLEFEALTESLKENINPFEIHKKDLGKLNLMKSDFPQNMNILLKDDIYVSKDGLSNKALAVIKSLAAFYNPEYYEKQAKRLSTYNIPRVMELFREEKDFLKLPRGCFDDLMKILDYVGIHLSLMDGRFAGEKISFTMNAELYENQKDAVDELMKHDTGLLIAPTGSGKTIMGMEIINRLKVPTLILVEQVKLLEQWKERMDDFAEILDEDGNIIAPRSLLRSEEETDWHC